MGVDGPLSPPQQRVVDELMGRGEPRPPVDTTLAGRLRSRLQDDFRLLADRLELVGAELHVTKGALSAVHQCERRHVSDGAFPGWNPSTARGTVAHRAIELSVFMKERSSPLQLVDRALDRIIESDDDRGPGEWLVDASAEEVAELRAEANELVVKFEECFPPLKPEWRPRLESKLKVELSKGVITLHAKPDLVLGKVEPGIATVLIVDFKTGRAYPSHADELRFYALVHTLRTGVPPFRVASYYLDSATWHHEDVTPEVLEVAARRLAAGVTKLVELRLNEREATFTPGPACRWCKLRDDCEGASAWDAGDELPQVLGEAPGAEAELGDGGRLHQVRVG